MKIDIHTAFCRASGRWKTGIRRYWAAEHPACRFRSWLQNAMKIDLHTHILDTRLAEPGPKVRL